MLGSPSISMEPIIMETESLDSKHAVIKTNLEVIDSCVTGLYKRINSMHSLYTAKMNIYTYEKLALDLIVDMNQLRDLVLALSMNFTTVSKDVYFESLLIKVNKLADALCNLITQIDDVEHGISVLIDSRRPL